MWILDSQRNLKFDFTFRDAFPISISGMPFDTTLDDITYIPVTAKFAYTLYDVNISGATQDEVDAVITNAANNTITISTAKA